MIPIAQPIITQDMVDAVAAVLRSGQISTGPVTEAFEHEFAAFVDAEYGVAVNSGTSALMVALMAAGIEAGDEVIVPSFTFAATANAVRLAGASPVFADIEPTTFNIDPDHVASLVSHRTAAIVPVHLFGQPANMTAISAIASRHQLYVLEDAAQAHGARWEGRLVGGIGDSAAFSFYPTKNMTTGEGGMITTNDASFARHCRLIRSQGMERRYVHEVVGMNLRMTDMGAAIGRIQLESLPGWNSIRQRSARMYDDLLSDVVRTPFVDPRGEHVYHQYTLRVADRAAYMMEFEESGVGFGIYYPTPTHLQVPYASESCDLPETDRASKEVFSIPIRPDLTDQERVTIIETVRRAAAEAAA